MAIPFLKGIDVSGTVDLGNLTIDGAQGTDGQVLTSTGSGIAWEDASGGASLSGGQASKVAVWSATDTLTHNDNFHFDTTNVRLGIGTQNPSHKLHVHSGADNDYIARFEGSTNNGAGVWTGIGIGGESNNTKSAIIFEDIGVNYSRGKLHLAVNNEQNQNNATKADAKLTVNNDGNVGIGETDPNRPLVVSETRYGSTASDAYTAVVKSVQTSGASPNPGTGGLKVQYTSSSSNVHAFGLVAGSSSSDFLTTGPMHFYTNSDLDTVSATGFAMQLDTSQRLILGSMTASQKLNVSGNVTADRYYGNGSTAYYVDPNDGTTAAILNGKVGIGTTSPSAKLDITQTATSQGIKIRSSSVQPEITFIDGATGDSFAIGHNRSGSRMDIEIDGTDTHTFKQNGDVGIGTTSPGYKLDVNGTVRLGQSATQYTRFGTYGTLLSTDTHISHNLYFNGSWQVISSSVPSSSIRLGTASSNEIQLQFAAAGSTAASTQVYFTSSGVGQATGSFRAPIFYDSNNTARYVNPAGTSSMHSIHMNNHNLTNVNQILFNDPGVNEGITWSGGNGWQIYESPDNMTNASGNLQFTTGTTFKFRVDTSGNSFSSSSSRAPIFYDTNNTGYYLDPASTSVALNINGKIAQAKEDYNIDSSHPNAIFQAARSTQTDRGSWPGSYYYAVNFGDRTKGIQLAAPYSSANRLYFRSGTDNSGAENGANIWKNWRQLYHDDYHPNADKWTTARTLTLNGDVSGSVSWDGSGNATLTTTVANNSHTHDDRYYTESESDGRFTSKDHIRSLGNVTLNDGTTTAAIISEIENFGAFDSYSSVFKTTWSYAGNSDLSDAGRLTELAGTSWLTWTDNSSDSTRGNITALVIAPNTGGSANKMFVYNDQGSSYSPGWREIWTSASDGAGSGLDADLLDGSHKSLFLYDQGSGDFRYNPGGSISSLYVGQTPTTGTGSSFINFVKQNYSSMPGAIYFYISPANTTNSTSSTYLKHIFRHDGDAHHDGDVIAYSTSTGSDKKLKKNIRDLEGALDKTLKLRGVKFDWKDENKANDQLGFIAQEVENVIPEVVKEVKTVSKDDETHLTVNYPALVPLLVEAIKDQQKQIDELKSIINGSS